MLRTIDRSELMEGIWHEYAIRVYEKYFASWLGFNKLINSEIVKQKIRLLWTKRSYSNSEYRKLYNQGLLYYHLFACESHSDAISTALGILSGEIKDCRSRYSSNLVKDAINWI